MTTLALALEITMQEKQTYELCHLEWSDGGDKVEILATCTADSEQQAARAFREQGYFRGHVRRQGSRIMRPLDLL